MAGRRPLLFLTNCSDDTKPYMIRVALIKGFQNHNSYRVIFRVYYHPSKVLRDLAGT